MAIFIIVGIFGVLLVTVLVVGLIVLSDKSSNDPLQQQVLEHSLRTRLPSATPVIAPIPAFEGQPDGLAPGIYCFGHIWYWDGSSWHHESSANIEPVTALVGDDEVWAVCWEEIWRRTNDVWQRLHLTKTRYFGVCRFDDKTYAVGARGAIACVHPDGTVTQEGVESGLLNSVCVSGATHEIFAVGSGGAIFRSDGDGKWHAESSPSGVDLQGVCASHSVTLAVGNDGVALRRDKSEWVVESTDHDGSFASVAAKGEVAYAVTSGGLICVRNDRSWRTQYRADSQLTDVFILSDTEIYVVGLGGTILWSDGCGEWIDCSGSRSVTLNTMWGSSADNIWVGGDQMYEITADGEGRGVEIVATT